jgi:two-component system OmpR family sensor kinase
MSIRQKRRRRMQPTRTAPIRDAKFHEPHTDRQALKERIVQLEDELRARDDFLAIAAHELRNPMTPISARVELLLARARNAAQDLPDGMAQGLEQLNQSIEAYMRKAAILLDVSRITSGNLRLEITETNLSALIGQVTANLAPMAERAGSRVRLQLEDRIVARCDAIAMEQILENLLSNAIRYGSGRPIDVVFCRDGDKALLSIQDQGIGISEENQARIFEHFHRLSRTSPKAGFGVGLWVTHQLIRMMEGEITVSSSPGRGSIFTVKLPLHWDDDDAR